LEKVLSGNGQRIVQRKKKRRKKIKTIFEWRDIQLYANVYFQ
jgi:hypothetical protein